MNLLTDKFCSFNLFHGFWENTTNVLPNYLQWFSCKLNETWVQQHVSSHSKACTSRHSCKSNPTRFTTYLHAWSAFGHSSNFMSCRLLGESGLAYWHTCINRKHFWNKVPTRFHQGQEFCHRKTKWNALIRGGNLNSEMKWALVWEKVN